MVSAGVSAGGAPPSANEDVAPAPSATPGRTIRQLLRQASKAALGTLDPTGAPYVSLVMIATDHAAAPLVLLSDLADHTQNFKRDGRASLLVDGTDGMASPLAGARATIMGRIEPTADRNLRARYLARHEDARGYADFADFALYRIVVERAHLVAGFGQIHWVDAAAVLWPSQSAAPLGAAEAEVLAHMNEDHRDAVGLYATRLLGQPEATWRLTGLDPEGADLQAGTRRCRLWFDKPVADAEAARVEFVRLVKRARQSSPASE